MHDYSIEQHPKQKIIFAIAFLAILATPYLNNLATTYLPPSVHPATAASLSACTLFGVIYFFFDRYLWRISVIRRLLLVPDLNGTWNCMGRTILKNGANFLNDWSAKITIVQSWSKIRIALKSSNSMSDSYAASVSNEPGTGYRLTYQYRNQPSVTEVELLAHFGTCDLRIDSQCTSAEGSYFTGKDRVTVGTMYLTRGGP